MILRISIYFILCGDQCSSLDLFLKYFLLWTVRGLCFYITVVGPELPSSREGTAMASGRAAFWSSEALHLLDNLSDIAQ